ncbi:hypothetical protein [Robertkochia aurantiaca]|uniref:hypothetical protein n=1 Tax=Robertkochia aurantiaca TaxID=2873700 RepID=UPI001CCC43C2|nr:hypothetical protein [Robertkochia sp. 3YJGBD-33]
MNSKNSLYGQDITEKRVDLKQNKVEIIQDQLKGYKIRDYLFNARAGQLLEVEMTTDNLANYFNIMEPQEEFVAVFNSSIDGNEFRGTLNGTGEYRIRVYLMRSAARRDENAQYELRLKLEDSVVFKRSSDVRVPGTEFHAIGQIPCSNNGISVLGSCEFGVIREGNGNAKVYITKDDGSMRLIIFKNGMVDLKESAETPEENWKVSKRSGTFNIVVGEERYEIPEAVIYGG